MNNSQQEFSDRLIKLQAELKQKQNLLDEVLTDAARYLGDDENINRVKDERIASAHRDVQEIKATIDTLTSDCI